MTIRIPTNFDDVTERELWDRGVYPAVVEDVTFIEPKSEEGSPQLQVDYTVTDGEHEGDGISQWVSLSPRAGFRAKAFYEAFGVAWPIEDFGVDEDTAVVVDPDISGSVVDILVTVEKHYKDRTRKVNKVNESSGAPFVRKSTYDGGGAEEVEEEPEEEAPRRPQTARRATPEAAAPKRSGARVIR